MVLIFSLDNHSSRRECARKMGSYLKSWNLFDGSIAANFVSSSRKAISNEHSIVSIQSSIALIVFIVGEFLVIEPLTSTTSTWMTLDAKFSFYTLLFERSIWGFRMVCFWLLCLGKLESNSNVWWCLPGQSHWDGILKSANELFKSISSRL